MSLSPVYPTAQLASQQQSGSALPDEEEQPKDNASLKRKRNRKVSSFGQLLRGIAADNLSLRPASHLSPVRPYSLEKVHFDLLISRIALQMSQTVSSAAPLPSTPCTTTANSRHCLPQETEGKRLDGAFSGLA